ncbi:MAG: SDR family oxidoreductase [bacterium]|nr:3-oxoacyl-ACP reductase [Deltaproteobacteria bacterium]MCP4905832.1 SDR family oxidoreductase [bacterium]
MSDRLAGKITIITGSGSGIGRASALRFAEEGATVIVNDIEKGGAEETVGLIAEAGGQAIAHQADITEPDQVEDLVARATRDYGRLDVMFNNAGGARPESTEEMTAEAYRTIMELNLDGVFYGTQSALRVMLPQKSGCILMTTSGAGLGAVLHLAAYGMAKAGVVNLGKSIAAEYGQYGIRSNVIAPGPMGSPGFMDWLATIEGGRERFETEIPVRRLGTPEDIAHTAVFLASDEASFVSGIVVPVDGGISSQYPTPQFALPDA